MQYPLKAQNGFALYEILLATAILVPLGMLAIQKQNTQLEEARGITNSERTQDFGELALAYYRANATSLRSAMSNGTGAEKLCRLGVDANAPQPEATGIQSNNLTLHTCAIDAGLLKWKQFAQPSFPELNLHQQHMVAIFRRIYNKSVNPPTPTDNVEMLIVGASGAIGIPNYAPNSIGAVGGLDSLIRDAKSMGASGGVIPDEDRVLCKWIDSDPTQREACGIQGGWKVTLSDFVGS
ncbi:hypothetical protein [Delftia sp. GW456-R20]|uniref:hypothetical protein n=1 Tax=Delftia sp. GW456-R20 TaxID=1827145 RepID=UPI000A706697|nr:hypothetical protein [Delftia sp. GW456-R20]